MSAYTSETYADLCAAHMDAVENNMRNLMTYLNAHGWECEPGDQPNIIRVLSTPPSLPVKHTPFEIAGRIKDSAPDHLIDAASRPIINPSCLVVPIPDLPS